VTKLMTAYVTMDAIRRGRLSIDSLVTMSATASRVQPSKMGFRPGTQITVENALKIIMVKSANDVANALGERVGGSIEGFVAEMNAVSQRLGMVQSVWANPHGLPDERQVTSARDMAILARAIQREFPQYQALFEIPAIRLGRVVMRNHNALIGRYPGADGMKTGFICASGFNVVASATRDGRRLITVVLGAVNARLRSEEAATLFERFFAGGRAAGDAPTVERLQPVALAPVNMREEVCRRNRPQPGESSADTPAQAEEAWIAEVDASSPTAFWNSEHRRATAPVTATTAPRVAFAPAEGVPAAAPPSLLLPRGPVQPVDIWIGPASARPAATPAAAPTATAAVPRRTIDPAIPPAAAAVTPRPAAANPAAASPAVAARPPAARTAAVPSAPMELPGATPAARAPAVPASTPARPAPAASPARPASTTAVARPPATARPATPATAGSEPPSRPAAAPVAAPQRPAPGAIRPAGGPSTGTPAPGQPTRPAPGAIRPQAGTPVPAIIAPEPRPRS
jgi:D-alanyl-D-alanine carboxypeptidase